MFTPKIFSDSFDAGALRRGAKYFVDGQVLEIAAESSLENGEDVIELNAVTAGSGDAVYHQRVVIVGVGSSWPEIDGECSCPVGFNCKHVAAVCLAYEASLFEPDEDEAGEPIDIDIADWLSDLQAAIEPDGAAQSHTNQRQAGAANARRPDFLAYKLIEKPSTYMADDGLIFTIELRRTRWSKNGKRLINGDQRFPHQLWRADANRPPTGYLKDIDYQIAQILKGAPADYSGQPLIKGMIGAFALQKIVATGRCYFEDFDGPPLTVGAPRELRLNWQIDAQPDGEKYVLTRVITPSARLLPTEPPMYLDVQNGEIGELATGGMDARTLAVLAQAPRVPEDRAEALSESLVSLFPGLPLPTPRPVEFRDNRGQTPQPNLTLSLEPEPTETGNTGPQRRARLDFIYGDDFCPALPKTTPIWIAETHGRLRIERDLAAETAAAEQLADDGLELKNADATGYAEMEFAAPGNNEIEKLTFWVDFIETRIPELRAAGWQVRVDDGVQPEIVDAEWQAELDENPGGGNDWFSLRFDLLVDGRQIPLAPVIAPLLGEPAAPLAETLPDPVLVPVEAGKLVRLPRDRVLPFLTTLRELFDREIIANDGEITLSRYDLAGLADIKQAGIELRGREDLQAMAERLRDFAGIESVTPPIGLRAELRGYQQSGLNWLQFLRAYRFNGVLADDMGLGKTVQTLAHLQLEKQQGRLDKPALVIAPTSLMGNWWREAARFTPQLRVTVLHGPERRAKFAQIAESDLLLTTYPLLTRDADKLLDVRYHSVILDEAQAIKNPRTKMARLVRRFDADHRLCLTGTPMENHLGELWALFDFLMPGFLGDEASFKRVYRTPIESHDDVGRRRSLAQRIRPFLLRREKAEVAAELPEKTEIVQRVQFEREQAELYESIRVTMDKKVREAISTQGLARSHITILDALLKLRQACCDPRLLKLSRAANMTSSAKLELLMDLLPEMLEEGRRVLLFSQFTSMLSLIEKAVKARKIAYSKLTGQTKKRDEAIQEFREGRARLFLISLKAGGVGLNLTEADTVILYDPWWNPAVEAQAIDRAHRIGQKNPVFVYRFVVENSVEEKMLDMQKRKRALAKGIYAENPDSDDIELDETTIRELFAPIK